VPSHLEGQEFFDVVNERISSLPGTRWSFFVQQSKRFLMVCIFLYLEIHFNISYSSYIFIGRQIKDCPDYSRSRRSTGSRNFSSGGSRSSPSSCHGWNQDWRWASEAQEDTDQEISEENQVRRRWSRCRL